MSATIIRGDARRLPLPDESVDLIVTSPPYFGLRSYQDGGEHYDGQIGAEQTPREYVAALLDCTREWMRVLKPGGSIFVDLGDKYSTYEGPRAVPQNNAIGLKQGVASQEDKRYTRAAPTAYGIPYKSLMLLPERYRIGCVDELGLIARAVIIWSKSNGMPSSATDRVRNSHEDWVHLTKRQRYFNGVDEIREQHTAPTRVPGANSMGGRNANIVRTGTGAYEGPNPLGKLPGSVWEIATQPLNVPDHVAHARCCDGRKREGCEDGLAHYAAFPTELPRRIISGWSPSGICTACGEGRRPVAERELTVNRKGRQRNVLDRPERGVDTQTLGWERVAHITGYACACPDATAPTRPALVVDPFGGTGTTALVADTLGRHGISIDRSADYCRLAAWRTTDPRERARALGLPKPPKPMDGQGDLFEAAS